MIQLKPGGSNMAPILEGLTMGELRRELIPVAAKPKRKRSSTSPTQRSLKHLRELGYAAVVVEKWNPHARIRQDLFGIADVMAIRAGEVLFVQATSDDGGGNVSARSRKIAEAEHVDAVRKAGIRIEVHGWRKRGNRWQVRIVDCS